VSGGHESGEIQQCLPADGLTGNGPPAPLVIGEPDPSLAELFEQNPVFLAKELDCGLLMTVDPACECRKEDLPPLNDVCHGRILG